jgi:hypothetical protein
MTKLEPADAALLADYCRKIVAKPLPDVTPKDACEAFMVFSATKDREDAGRILAAPDNLTDEDARWAIQRLFFAVEIMRAEAYASADAAARAAVPGGCFTRMFVNDLSPEADALEALAIRIILAIPGLDPVAQLRLAQQ